MKINLQSRTRRELADHIGEILGAIPRYLGVPTCNYQIGIPTSIAIYPNM